MPHPDRPKADSRNLNKPLTKVPHAVHLPMIKRKPTKPRLDAIFFKSEGGAEPVRAWLFTLTKEDRKQIGEDIAYVQYKWPLGKPRVDHLQGPIWEVRTTLKTRIARVMFAVETNIMLLLHGVIKKTTAADQADINLALARYKEWKKHHGKN